MKLFTNLLIVALLLAVIPAAGQIRFFQGSYEEALKKAKDEKKDLFIDFWAEWCGPCKLMAQEVFTLPQVGEYFNGRFVCVQLNVEEAANQSIAKKYVVEALPTLLFVSREGKELRRSTGAIPDGTLLHEAKIALGEALSFEQLYDKYKKNKKDYDTQQQLLLEAPSFMAKQKGYDREKWSVRMESMFPDYLKNKKLANMKNEADLMILTLYHPQTSKEDPVFDYLVKHYDEFVAKVDTALVAGYLMRLNNSYIIQLCKQSNPAYKERINLVDGDLSKVYAGFSFGKLTVKEAITLLADATYALNKHDLPHFFGYMDEYFAGKGDKVELNDYTQPLENLAMAYEGKLPDEAYGRCIPWIGKALEFKEATPEIRTRLLVMMGQCFQHTNNAAKAKQCYNQAFMECARIENQAMAQQMKQMVQQSLEGAE